MLNKVKHCQRQKNLLRAFISFMLMGLLLLPVSVSADAMTISETTSTLSDHDNALTFASKTPNKKKVLNEESRELSAFFILGIIINIIMIIIFVWWFSSEWQKNKK